MGSPDDKADAGGPLAGGSGVDSAEDEGCDEQLPAKGRDESRESFGDDDEDDEFLEGDPNDDASPDGEEGDAAVEEIEWEEIYACPLNVRFTQEKIHPFFYRRGPIVNVVPKIRPVPHPRGGQASGGDWDDVVELVPPFPPIQCLRKGDELWSLDNRRLYALQLAAMEQWPQQCCVRLLSRERLPRHKFKTQYRKFNTTSGGRTIDVCARYQQFDTWNWFDRAVELEVYNFSQRLGTLLSFFEIVPVVCALLFRTGLTGFSSRGPLIAGFVLTFAVDLLRQKVPVLEKRVCEFHVRAIMDGEVSPCWWRLWADQSSCGGGGGSREPISMPQLAATMAMVLGLLIPYVMGLAYERLRSSLISCWLGVACVLVVQLGAMLRGGGAAGLGADLGSGSGAGPRLSPKHRGLM